MGSASAPNLASPFPPLRRAESQLVIGALALGIAISLFFSIYDGASAIRYISLILYISALAIPFLTPSFTPSLFHPITFYTLWVGVRGLIEGGLHLGVFGIHYHRAIEGLTGGLADQVVAKHFLLETVALLSVYIGYLSFPYLTFRTLATPSVTNPALKCAGWVALAGLAVLVIATAAGGFDSLLMQRGLVRTERVGNQLGGHWHLIAKAGAIAMLVWYVCDQTAIRRKAFWVLLLVSLALGFMATGSRGGAVMPLIMMGFVWTYRARRIRYMPLVAIGLVSLILLGSLGEFRRATMKSESLDQVTLDQSFLSWITNAAYELSGRRTENSGQLAIVARVPDEVPFLNGQSYLSIPYIFVPRILVGEKPRAGGYFVAVHFFGTDLNTIPPTAVGEAYWNFSYPGVIAIFLLFGCFLKVVTAFFAANPNHPAALVALLCVLFYASPSSDATYAFLHTFGLATFILLTLTLKIPGRIRIRLT